MLTIVIPENEWYNEITNEFTNIKETKLQLEHSLVSISKWESKWNKPFLSKTPRTTEETLDYIKCMTLTQNVDPNVYLGVNTEIIKQINDYIDAPMSATTFSDVHLGPPNREIITSELIYYWMVAANIPFECQKWHLNRLLTLIKICGIKNATPKKQSRRDVLNRNRSLNQARRMAMNSSG